MTTNPAEVIREVGDALLLDRTGTARALIREKYPFRKDRIVSRSWSPEKMARVFVRDGFIDRYTGHRLILPGMLRLLSVCLPDEFPFQKNWKMSETHPAFWELCPTIDHAQPIACGGADDESNWVTTSMRSNSAKANWTLEELGWVLHPPGDIARWDGLTAMYLQILERRPELRTTPYLKKWERAAKKVLSQRPWDSWS